MRTTLTIDDDVFFEAKRKAAAEKISIGSVLSDLARQALQAQEPVAAEHQCRSVADAKLLALGVASYYAPNGKPVSNAKVNEQKESLNI